MENQSAFENRESQWVHLYVYVMSVVPKCFPRAPPVISRIVKNCIKILKTDILKKFPKNYKSTSQTMGDLPPSLVTDVFHWPRMPFLLLFQWTEAQFAQSGFKINTVCPHLGGERRKTRRELQNVWPLIGRFSPLGQKQWPLGPVISFTHH